MHTSTEFEIIKTYYGDRIANRSKVPLINHITEGLIILDSIGASIAAKNAYCVHPIVQDDESLKNNFHLITTSDPYVIILAMEYRSVANEFLSQKVDSGQQIRLSPLKDVNDMLIADKIQNYKDFMIHHYDTHPRSNELFRYFNMWFDVLNCRDQLHHLICKIS